MTPPHRPPTALLGERGDRLCAAVAEGLSLQRACAAAGVPYDTARYWLRRGADLQPPDPTAEPYRSFARRLRAAEAVGKTKTPPGPRYGRLPADLSPDQRAALAAAVRKGWTYHEACKHAGVRLSTFLSWLRLGGYPRTLTYARPLEPAYVAEPYRSFADAILFAEEGFLAQTPAG